MRDRLFLICVFVVAAVLADFSLVPADAATVEHPTEMPTGMPTEMPTEMDVSSSGRPAAAGNLDLIEFPSPIVVESAPLAMAGSAGVIDGEHGTSPEAQEAMERHREQIRAEAAARARFESMVLPSSYAASYGGIAVSYDSSNPAPTSVRTVINAAVAEWDSVLATDPSGPIVIEVSWADLGHPSLLGYAGPISMYAGGSLPTSSTYPVALVNTLLGIDANGPSKAEVHVVLNSELLTSNRWYIATTGTPGYGQIDLFSVVLHEVGHGLGFLGSGAIRNGDSTPSLYNPPYVFDALAHWNGAPVANAADQAAVLISGDVHANISDSASYELYAPSNWSQGSSFSHFDESTYPAGSPGALMTPMLSSGEVARTLDAPTLGLMAKSGWPVTVNATTPTITNVSASLTSTIVSWEHNLTSVGVFPNSYVVQAWSDGSTLQSSVVAPASSKTATVGSLTPGRSYTIKVVPMGPNGEGVAASSSVQLPASGGPASKSEWPYYIRDLPLDGQINRLYQAYFLRLADQSGFEYWIDQRAAWRSLGDVSAAFAGSAEFQAQYGSLTDEAFVDLVYANVLNRPADADGRAYWIGQLSAGASRGLVMVGFAESAEYVARTSTVAATTSTEAKINRLYNAVFLRAPDADGLSYWPAQVTAGTTLETIAGAFVQSAEFQNRYGALSDEAFVGLVYDNVLGRAPDGDGSAYWVGRLQSGLDRGAVMVGFSESAEFIKSTGTIP